MISLLLHRGAEIDALDRDRRTALTWAIVYGRVGAVRLLLRRGANVALTDENVLLEIGMERRNTTQEQKEKIWALFEEARE